jgi:hypothetical protein
MMMNRTKALAAAAAAIALTACGSLASTDPAVVTAPVVAKTDTAVHAKQTVTYETSGSAAQVTYGPAGTSLNGKVPMKVTAKLASPVFYSITAQLQGGGSVTVKILVNGKVVSKATATGGYNIASAEISQDPLSGKWTDING